MRIYIVGPGGSGKSTLAKRLGSHFNIPVIHLDELQWKPEWIENKEYRNLQNQAILQDNWIIEGSSVSILKTMKDCVDVVIILNHSPVGNIFRIFKRYLKGIFFQEKRIGWAMENIHGLRADFLFNTLRWGTRQLPRIRANIKEYSLEGKVIELQSLENIFERIVNKLKYIT
ncbi:hypothetical protein GW819_02625 [Candidatus Gracilibacteria bacterium]|nr:hypothetical protein [Candidatus Gracilibacteria bacterium]OIO76067.1 MAG: hypothetical protein AUJ87_03565 [Candidatus Gracilibacteria bacterium CG1_02_38_174]PIQ10901.1 MAG: hypothetical protein COW68_03550 [Candidatus Gracilibacteria bacterium CG18_big_fil_WC_8_21_14_2_50_38_16]PIQ41972.1 MAG: hypothetical protein COW06_01190 [Candidatus Gracilibacteria bacterium CG12_big_fil_rev_8_21_14_0_65_38_15]PIZ02096.1 MAG: hypothetical protein COY60_00145 [Candidatus Gracilibacteria bacterium CG_4